MTRSKTVFLIFVLLITASAGLFAEELKANANQEEAKRIFTMFYNGSSDAANYVLWDDLYVNNQDVTELYYESLDYGDDDVFKQEMVTAIKKLLRYQGDSKDSYTNWSFGNDNGDLVVRCKNKKKDAAMTFTIGNNSKLFVSKISIIDRKK